MVLTIFGWTSMLVALIGLVFVIKIFLMWNHIDKSMLKAKVYLDEKFLYNNWIYLFWIGTFTVFHQAFVIVYNSTIPILNIKLIELKAISDIFEFASVILIVIFCYRWYKLMAACTFKS